MTPEQQVVLQLPGARDPLMRHLLAGLREAHEVCGKRIEHPEHQV